MTKISEKNFNITVADLLLNIDAPIQILFSVKYSNFSVTSFLRSHHAYME